MSIPESQLQTWTNQGAVVSAKATHESIRAALAASSSPIADRLASGGVDVYLQGSYKNSTNIRGDSDVDIVVQLDTTFGRDLSALPRDQVERYNRSYSNATYLWEDFRADVLAALRAYYAPGTITEGNKAITVAAGSGRLAADVVPALLYRKYRYFRSLDDQSYVPGIKFYDRAGRQIINFPKVHYDNGVSKNADVRTGGRYKPSVRMFKNARTYLVSAGAISADLCPSYFLECLLYNVPDVAFSANCEDTFLTAFRWLASPQNLADCMCQNEQLPLFGDTLEQWSQESASAFIVALANLWDSWR